MPIFTDSAGWPSSTRNSLTAWAVMWASVWRPKLTISTSLLVSIATVAPSGRVVNRSVTCPSTRIPRAALASPGPMAAATSNPVAPLASSRFLPSGRTTCILLSSLSLPLLRRHQPIVTQATAPGEPVNSQRYTPCMHLVAISSSNAELLRLLWRFRDPLGRFHLHTIAEHDATQLLPALAPVEFAGAIILDPQ